jgi:hypothetical protein
MLISGQHLNLDWKEKSLCRYSILAVNIGRYEINQESGFEANLCLRPAKVTDNSVHGDAVKVDFTSGQLGGSLTSPREFMSSLVVRADGFWTGLITCNALPHHAELADFVSAYNIYSLLGEL